MFDQLMHEWYVNLKNIGDPPFRKLTGLAIVSLLPLADVSGTNHLIYFSICVWMFSVMSQIVLGIMN